MSAVATTTLVLVRHGESNATVDQVVGGIKGCTGLSASGREQAVLLHDRLSATGELAAATALYASVLPRAIETAQVIRGAVGSGDLEIAEDCDLCELHPGECDGMPWSEYAARYGTGFTDHPDHPLSPGGESWTAFVARASARLTGLVEEHRGETVVVACHGGIVVSSMISLLGLPASGHRAEFHPVNTSITEWTFDGDHPSRLVRFNDAAHLAGAR